MKDENTIGFVGKKYNQQALEIKDYIENKLLNKDTIITSTDKYDQLSKIKKLLDENVISQEEFENEKKKILNL